MNKTLHYAVNLYLFTTFQLTSENKCILNFRVMAVRDRIDAYLGILSLFKGKVFGKALI